MGSWMSSPGVNPPEDSWVSEGVSVGSGFSGAGVVPGASVGTGDAAGASVGAGVVSGVSDCPAGSEPSGSPKDSPAVSRDDAEVSTVSPAVCGTDDDSDVSADEGVVSAFSVFSDCSSEVCTEEPVAAGFSFCSTAED